MFRRTPGLAGVLAQLVRLDLPGPIARDGVRYSWDSYSRTLRRLILDAPALRWLSQLQVPVRLVAARDDCRGRRRAAARDLCQVSLGDGCSMASGRSSPAAAAER